MLYLAVLITANLLLFALLKKFLDGRMAAAADLAVKSGEYEGLLKENKRLRAASADSQNELDGIIALYDITKEICKSLDADKVFSYFKDVLNKYIKAADCRLLKGNSGLADYSGYAIFPLSIQDELIGRLAVRGLKEEDRERFQILSRQFLLGIKRAILYEGVQMLSIIDSLTGVFNRRYYLERFREELERSERFNYVFSCLMVDLDYFKTFNDRYGHIVGDAILREVSKTIQENIRQVDLLGRFGGEEFSIILSETDKEAALFAAERIRRAIGERRIRVYDEELKVTVSIGVSTYPADSKEIEKLIDAADAALYRAKQAGRNKVCV